MKFIRIYMILIALLSFSMLSPEAAVAQIQNEQAQNSDLKAILSRLNRASSPSKFFVIPTGDVLESLEIYMASGSFYGQKESGGLEGRIAMGLGGMAELELNTTRVTNQLTGVETRFPSKTIKVNLVPVALRKLWYMPQLALQLRSASWAEAINRNDVLPAVVRDSYNARNSGYRLQSLEFQTRFTTLYAIAGFETRYGGIYGGWTLTDVRTRGGGQRVFNEEDMVSEYKEFSPQQKNLYASFAGIFLNANETTQFMAEISAVPNLNYDPVKQEPAIDKAWAGIAGIRFFMMNWLSLDAGVRYLDTFDGIADADVNLALNAVVPLGRIE